MLGITITISLIVGWILGFVTYFGVKVGYQLLKAELEEGKAQ